MNEANKELREKVNKFLQKNFPQIKMHGGEFTIQEADVEDGYVSIQLSGACSGCGISPMTTEALRNRLPKNVDGVKMVNVTISDGSSGGFGDANTTGGFDDSQF